MHEKINNFIKENRLLNLAVQDEKAVYIASVFYTFDEPNLSLIFASEARTKHVKLALKNPNIAFSIAKDSPIAFIKGLQAKASFALASELQRKMYLSSFPMARLIQAEFYALTMTWAKFTDNSLAQKLYFP